MVKKATIKERIKLVDIDKIKPYHLNAKKHSEKQIEQLIKSVSRFGYKVPISVDKNNVIVSGHGRYYALKKDGFKKVEVVDSSDLSPKEVRQFRILDNKIISNEWDNNMLFAEIDNIYKGFGDIDKIADDLGFEKNDFLKLMPAKETKGDDDIPKKIKSITKLGDLWELGRHRLLCGDNKDLQLIQKLFLTVCPNILITSPPYWNQREYSHWKKFDDYMIDMSKVFDNLQLDNNAIIFWNIGDDSPNHQHISAKHSVMLENIGLKYIDAIVWKKQGITGIRLSHQKTKNMYYPGFCFELCLVFQKDDGLFPIFESKYYDLIPRGNVWEISTESNHGKKHSAPFPVKLPETALMCYTNDVLNKCYDPFLGSGTTLIACEKTNRICYGMELDEHYCDVIRDRYIDFCKKNNIKTQIKLNGKLWNPSKGARNGK